MLKLGIFGCGNMASAIAQGLYRQDKQIIFYCYNRTVFKAQQLAQLVNGKFCQKSDELADCDVILLGVKPQNLNDVTPNLQALPNKRHVISMLAGVNIERLKQSVPGWSLSRMMPNLPMLHGQGISLIYHQPELSTELSQLTENLLRKIALVIPVSTEDKFDLAMMITASGPAYLFELARILESILISHQIAQPHEIVKQLFLGSANLMDENFQKLREQITSKGGVTEQALAVFAQANLAQLVETAVAKGHEHARKLNHFK